MPDTPTSIDLDHPRPKLLPRIVLFTLTALTTAVATWVFVDLFGADGLGILDGVLIVLFVVLFIWISLSFWTATMGFIQCVRKYDPHAIIKVRSRLAPVKGALPRTALLMPVYNEDPARTFAGLAAIHESLRATGLGDRFDIFVLSDSTDPDRWIAEEQAWAQFKAGVDGQGGQIFYRRRHKNLHRKSGNISDWLRRWGAHYKYFIILDADSVMAGPTLVEMTRRMEADDRIGILQAPPVPVNRGSLFARCQQFAASVYGEIFTTGFAMWTQVDGNYYGHNAIIRTEAFTRYCGLPELPGKAPLGGEILSHDFVEAALMRRAGYKIQIAHDLPGSYEECPTTLIDFAKRDQRWCQGNLQHLRLVFAYGFHPISRIHLGMGAMSYLSSPLWLLFMVVGGIVAATVNLPPPPAPEPPEMPAERSAEAPPERGPHGSALTSAEALRAPDDLTVGALPPAPDSIGEAADGVALSTLTLLQNYRSLVLFVGTMTLLLLPKLWSFLLLLMNRDKLAAHGGEGKVALSVLIETLVSIVMAPILMAFHATFVAFTLAGHSVHWGPQRRSDSGITLSEAIDAHGGHTVAGITAAVATWLLAPGLFPWLTPIFFSLIFSAPISMVLSSARLGEKMRRAGLLLIPEETHTPRVLERTVHFHRENEALAQGQKKLDPISRLLIDPALFALHLETLAATGHEYTQARERTRQVALYGGPRYLKKKHKAELLADPQSLEWLHRAVWRQWPRKWLKAVSASAAPADGPLKAAA